MNIHEMIQAYRLGKKGLYTARKIGRVLRKGYGLLTIFILLVMGGICVTRFIPEWKDKIAASVNRTLSGDFVKEQTKQSEKNTKSVNKSSKSKDIIKKKGLKGPFKIKYILDGDTFTLNNGTKVRMIGIDTPESVHQDSSNNTAWGKKASDYTKKQLSGKKVWLEYDKEKKDVYGRTLAYVWIKQGKNIKMYNKILLKKGYARAVYYAPNGRYKKKFDKLQRKAHKEKKGFWRDGFVSAFPNKRE